MANPDDKPSTLELKSCSTDSRGDESEHLDFKSAHEDRSHKSNNVQWWFEISDLNSDHEDYLLDSGHCRGQFFSINGDQSQCSNHDNSCSEKLDLAPDYGDKFDNCDHTLTPHQPRAYTEVWLK